MKVVVEWWRSGGRVMVSDGNDDRVESQGGGGGVCSRLGCDGCMT